MLSVFAAPGNFPEIHELEALITHVALSPLVCSQTPQERLQATFLLHLSRTARAEQIMISRPFHRALVAPHPSLMQGRPSQVKHRLSLLLVPAWQSVPHKPMY